MGHVIELLDKLDDQELRDWYAAKDVHHSWSRPVLAHQITTRLYEREAAAPSSFAGALERPDSDQAQEITKDPYALEFLAVDGDASERELEQRMVDRILDTMRELGPGFAFVGRKNDTVIRYALASTTQPVAVSRYELGDDEQRALPDEDAITRAFADELARGAEGG